MELLKESKLALKDEFNALFSPEDIEMLVKFDELEKRVKAMKDAKNESLKQFLIDNDLTEEGFENSKIRISYVKPSVRKVVDTKKLKEEGLYELYVKDSNVSDSVRISIKYEEWNRISRRRT